MSTFVKRIAGSSSQWLGISLILALAAALYLFRLGSQSLWIDELYSIYDARHFSVVDALTETSRPLYYLLLMGWSKFGGSEFWLRAMSIPFSLGSVYLTYELGRRVAGQAVGLWASLFLCLSPLVINHTQEVRMYALSVFLGLAGALALTRALETPVHRRIGVWAIARILALLATPANLSLLVVDLLLIGLSARRDRRVLTAFAKWSLLILVVCFPALFHFSLEGTEVMTTGWITEVPKPDINSIFRRLIEFVVGKGLSERRPCLLLLSLLSLVLVAASLADKRKNGEFRLIAAWAFIPLLLALLVSFLSSSIWNVPRYQLMAVPYLLIILANGLVWLWHRHKSIGIAIALAYFIVVATGLQVYYWEAPRQNWRGLFRAINAREETGDVIVICTSNPRPYVAAAYYHKGTSPVRGVQIQTFESELDNLLSTVSAAHPRARVWLIYKKGQRAEQARLATFFKKHSEFQTEFATPGKGGGLELFLLTRHSG